MLDKFSPKCYAFQREKGAEGTEHFQGFFQTKNPVWTNSIKAKIQGIWVEPATNNTACWQYSTKDDETYIGDRTTFGPPPTNANNKGGRSKDLLKYIQEKGFLEAA